MIKLFDGRITDLIANQTRNSPEVRAISYALRQEKQRIMGLSQGTRTMTMIGQMPEYILDVLAVELRTPYYSGDMTLDQKRAVVRGTLAWHMKAGTPAAVQELITAVFGRGRVVEWFDFTEEPRTPGTFDIVTDTQMTEDIAAQFLRIIRRVKNTRSHIRTVQTERTGEDTRLTVHIGAGLVSAPHERVLNAPQHTRSIHGRITVKAAAVASPSEQILNTPAPRQRVNGMGICPAVGAVSAPKEQIVNHAAPQQRHTGGSLSIGTALVVRNIHRIVLSG